MGSDAESRTQHVCLCCIKYDFGDGKTVSKCGLRAMHNVGALNVSIIGPPRVMQTRKGKEYENEQASAQDGHEFLRVAKDRYERSLAYQMHHSIRR